MFVSKRKLKEENTRLRYRVAELEERLCPCEGHAWKHIGGVDLVGGTGMGDELSIYNYKCRRCGKTMRSIQPFLDREDTGSQVNCEATGEATQRVIARSAPRREEASDV